MYKQVLTLLFLAVLGHLHAADPIRTKPHEMPSIMEPTLQTNDELSRLNDLISLTSKNLENQKVLYGLIGEYKLVHDRYLENMKDKKLSYQMVMKAHEVYCLIQELHLVHVFDQEFISELTFFNSIAERWTEPQST